MYKLLNYVVLGAFALFLVLGIFQAATLVSDLVSPPKDYKQLYEASLNENVTIRDDYNRLVTKTETIEATATDFINLVTHQNDSLTRRLQQTVKHSKGKVKHAAAYTGTTAGTLTGKTRINELSVIDTNQVKPDPLPTYYADLSNEFIRLEITAGPDTTTADYKYVQMLDIWQTQERPLLKPWKTVTYVRDLNPYAESQEIKTYTVPTAKPRRGIWFLSGAAAVIAAAIVIK